MFLTKLNPVEPPWYVTRMPGGVGGEATARCPPIPILGAKMTVAPSAEKNRKVAAVVA